jgi:hypothetical protein
LPHDVVSDILSRLPVKSVCRFRCVSAEWRTLIADSVFVSQHKLRAGPLMLGSCTETSSLRLIDMDGNVVRVIRKVGSACSYICSREDDIAYAN